MNFSHRKHFISVDVRTWDRSKLRIDVKTVTSEAVASWATRMHANRKTLTKEEDRVKWAAGHESFPWSFRLNPAHCAAASQKFIAVITRRLLPNAKVCDDRQYLNVIYFFHSFNLLTTINDMHTKTLKKILNAPLKYVLKARKDKNIYVFCGSRSCYLMLQLCVFAQVIFIMHKFTKQLVVSSGK